MFLSQAIYTVFFVSNAVSISGIASATGQASFHSEIFDSVWPIFQIINVSFHPKPIVALLLTIPECKPDGPLRLESECRDLAGYVDEHTDVDAVVKGAGSEVVRIEVGPEQHDLFGPLASADFTDHVLDKLDSDEFRMRPFNAPAGN